MRQNFLTWTLVVSLVASCAPLRKTSSTSDIKDSLPATGGAIDSPMPPATLQQLKQALPRVGYEALQVIFQDPQTVWYDHDSMKPSYQAAIQQSPPYGANSNDRWFRLIASSVQPVAREFYDEGKARWRFPFSVTAGTDNSANLRVFNFLSLPKQNGHLLPLAAGLKPAQVAARSSIEYSWGWVYPVGAILGELMFITGGPNNELLPVEIRIRTRHESGWSINAFRPFPKASQLAHAIKTQRPNWQSTENLRRVVEHLENSNTLQAKSLVASQLPGTFEAHGALDVLPDLGDADLQRDLLTKTVFVSAYNTPWKVANNLQTFAASSTTGLSIVPKNYEGGLIEVTEASCMRCHQDTGRHLTNFRSDFSPIVLYGEMWGRDGIFSFHPFDESRYSVFWLQGTRDNRAFNPKLQSQGVVTQYNANTHRPPLYPAQEFGAGPSGVRQ